MAFVALRSPFFDLAARWEIAIPRPCRESVIRLAEVTVDDSDHAERVGIILAQRGLVVTCVAEIGEAIKRLQAEARAWEIVMLVIGEHAD